MSNVEEMTSRLEELVRRFDLITAEMGSPDVVGDANKLRKLGKEHAELSEVVALFTKWKALMANHEEAEQLLRTSDDPEMRELAKEEYSETAAQAEEVAQQLTIQLLPKDPNDGKNIILEIRAGTGGDESALFAGDLFSMYRRLPKIAAGNWKSAPTVPAHPAVLRKLFPALKAMMSTPV